MLIVPAVKMNYPFSHLPCPYIFWPLSSWFFQSTQVRLNILDHEEHKIPENPEGLLGISEHRCVDGCRLLSQSQIPLPYIVSPTWPQHLLPSLHCACFSRETFQPLLWDITYRASSDRGQVHSQFTGLDQLLYHGQSLLQFRQERGILGPLWPVLWKPNAL